ncbi:MAG: carboxypeptidase regulatory-like domain-containing protein [Pyrinomonadaceae bacterium]
MKSYPTQPNARAARRAITLLLLALFIHVSAAAQEGEGGSTQGTSGRSARGQQKEGRATVRGRVTFGDNGKPVRRAVVTLLTDINHPDLLRTLTDRRGEFRFRGVPAGKYIVAADAPGIVSRSSGFSFRDTGLGLEGIEKSIGRVTVGEDGEAKVEFSVERGGALGGRVTYSDGEPVAGAYLLLYTRKGGELTRYFTDLARTDDRGSYRVEGLPPGEYVVGVIEKGAGGKDLLPRTEGVGLASRYHPAAASAKDAAAVRVVAGEDSEDVDVRLAENELRRLSGVVRWRRSGDPAPNATVMLRRRADPGVEVSVTDFLQNITPADYTKDDTMMRDMMLFTMMSSNAPYVETDEAGRWSFEDVPPGAYLLTVIASLPAEKTDKPEGVKGKDTAGDSYTSDFDRPNVQKRLTLTLGSSDITDHRIELTEGGRISGVVTVDGGAPPSFGVKVSAVTPGMGIESLFGSYALAKQDGTFLLEAVTPGEVNLEVTMAKGKRYYIRSITANGADLLRGPLRVADGAETAGVRIDLGSDPAKVSGQIFYSDDRSPAAGAVVLLVAADEQLWQSKTSRLYVRADTAGEFSVEAPPGDYLLFVWRPGEEPAGSFEGYVRSRAASARRVSLKPGDNPRLELPAARGEGRK